MQETISPTDFSPVALGVAEAAARREGIPVGEWLSGIVAHRWDAPPQNGAPLPMSVIANLQRSFVELQLGKLAPKRPDAHATEAGQENKKADLGRPSSSAEIVKSIGRMDEWAQNQHRIEEHVLRLTSSVEQLADIVVQLKEERRSPPVAQSRRRESQAAKTASR